MDQQTEIVVKQKDNPHFIQEFEKHHDNILTRPDYEQKDALTHDIVKLIPMFHNFLRNNIVLGEKEELLGQVDLELEKLERAEDIIDPSIVRIRLADKDIRLLSTEERLVLGSRHLGVDVSSVFDAYNKEFSSDGLINEAKKVLPPELSPLKQKQLEGYTQLVAVLRASAAFMQNPTEANWQKLLTQKIDLQTMALVVAGNNELNMDYISRLPQTSLDGAEADIYYNLLFNACTYGLGEPSFYLTTDNYQTIIGNQARNPLEEGAFNFEMIDKGGRTHYGLYLAKLLALRHGWDLTASSPKEKTNDGLYPVSFTLNKTPQSQPAPTTL